MLLTLLKFLVSDQKVAVISNSTELNIYVKLLYIVRCDPVCENK